MAVAALTRSVRDLAGVFPSLIFAQALWVAPLIATATLNPTFTTFLLTIVGAAVSMALAFTILATTLLTGAELDGYRESVIPDMTTSIVASWLLLGVSVAVIVSQYRTRRFKRSLLVGVAGVILSVFVADFWPWRFAKGDEPQPGAWARDTTRVAAVLVQDATSVSDGF